MKWLKFFVGFLLLPFVAAQLAGLYDVAMLWLPTEPWRLGWFWGLAGGVLAWLVIYFSLPRPVWFYVLGHELTHAFAIYLSGGKVYDIRVAASGGHVASNKVRWWISLSPYFVPLYTLIWLGLWFSVNFYYPLQSWHWALFFGVGFTYAFHVSFTLSMLHPRQTDLSSEGWLFSGVVLLAMNALVIAFFFIIVAQDVTWRQACAVFAARIAQCYMAAWHGLLNLFTWARRAAK
jgi:hypothetical protein